ncbi:MAG: TRAP transporter small permease subunit [Alphaproteobacteria bacterium]|nr:TRAP transporter small permease subunit [Alphaproteobacteria bacterium]
MLRVVQLIDLLSTWIGKCFGWMIMVLTFSVGYEVFVRYVLNKPTTWAFDVSYISYGALFMMAGAYALSRNGQVRADVVYRLLRPRTQAIMDLTLHILFYFPAVLAFIWSGWNFARMSFMFKELSIFSPAGIPVFPLKMLIPLTGVVLFIQGIAEVLRCILCIRDGEWPPRVQDVEETEVLILQQQKAMAAPGDAPAKGH